jgi:hypothetical protein
LLWAQRESALARPEYLDLIGDRSVVVLVFNAQFEADRTSTFSRFQSIGQRLEKLLFLTAVYGKSDGDVKELVARVRSVPTDVSMFLGPGICRAVADDVVALKIPLNAAVAADESSAHRASFNRVAAEQASACSALFGPT